MELEQEQRQGRRRPLFVQVFQWPHAACAPGLPECLLVEWVRHQPVGECVVSLADLSHHAGGDVAEKHPLQKD